MEKIESIVWIVAGYIPTIVALEAFASRGMATIKSVSPEIEAEREGEVLIRRE